MQPSVLEVGLMHGKGAVDPDLAERFYHGPRLRWVRRLPAALVLLLIGTQVFLFLRPFDKAWQKRRHTPPPKSFDTRHDDGTVSYHGGRFVRLFTYYGRTAVDPQTLGVPHVTVTDLAQGREVRARITADPDSLKLAGLPKSTLHITVVWEGNPDNPPMHPGDYFADPLDITLVGGWATAHLQVLSVMGLDDDFVSLPGSAFCAAQRGMPSPGYVSWTAPAPGAELPTYVWSLRRGTCDGYPGLLLQEGELAPTLQMPLDVPGQSPAAHPGQGALGPEAVMGDGTAGATPETEAAAATSVPAETGVWLEPAAGEADAVTVFRLEARMQGRVVGRLLVPGDDGVVRDYLLPRFVTGVGGVKRGVRRETATTR